MSDFITLKNCRILTMNEEDDYFESGKLVIKDDKILELGAAAEVESKGNVLNMEGKLVLPGFINTHTHSPSPIFRGMADDLELMEWLKEIIWPAEKNLTEDMAYWGSALSLLEFLRTGVTTFADQYFFAESIGRAVEKSGLRGFIAPTVIQDSTPESSEPLKVAADFVRKYKKRQNSRVYPCIGPHAPYSCDDHCLQNVANLASKYDLMIHIHISETNKENERMLEDTGLTPTRYLEQIGLFKQKVLAAHCIHLSDRDIEVLTKNDVSISYNPVSNLKLASGIMPLKKLVKKDIPVSLGTDGAQSNNSLNLLRDLKTGVLIQKNYHQDASFFEAREALRMITIKGARALGMSDKIGSLKAGKKADLITMDLSGVNLNPVHKNNLESIYSMVVYSSSGFNVTDVIVDGEIVMKDRKFLKLNKDKVLKKANKASQSVMERAGLNK